MKSDLGPDRDPFDLLAVFWMLKRLWEYTPPGVPRTVGFAPDGSLAVVGVQGAWKQGWFLLDASGSLQAPFMDESPYRRPIFADRGHRFARSHSKGGARLDIHDGGSNPVATVADPDPKKGLFGSFVSEAALCGEGNPVLVAFSSNAATAHGQSYRLVWATGGAVDARAEGGGYVKAMAHGEDGKTVAVIAGFLHSTKSGTYWTEERVVVFARDGSVVSTTAAEGAGSLAMSISGDRLAYSAGRGTKDPRIVATKCDGPSIFSAPMAAINASRGIDSFSEPLGFLPDSSLWVVTRRYTFGGTETAFTHLSAEGEWVGSFRLEQALSQMAVPRSLSRFAVSAGKGLVTVFSPEGASLGSAPLHGRATALAISAAGDRIVAGTNKKSVVAFELAL